MTHQFPNFNGATIESGEWKKNFTPHLIGNVITHPRWEYYARDPCVIRAVFGAVLAPYDVPDSFVSILLSSLHLNMLVKLQTIIFCTNLLNKNCFISIFLAMIDRKASIV